METNATDHMRADLDQVYFDRVHPVLPLIYPRNFLSWADQENPGAARACLRSAMRTIAAAMSAPGCRFCNEFYAETCRLLENHNMKSNPDQANSIEHLQAWLLVAHYELLRVNEHQAMLTAGRCFRLVLMARLFEIDTYKPGETKFQVSHTNLGKNNGFKESFSFLEEKRRTFWLAFCLDRFLCSRNDYPLTLSEEMIFTRLPSPEANFQNNQHICTSFLEEAFSLSQKGAPLSPFAECIILSTLHGRCMVHRRFFSTKQQTGNMDGNDFWTHRKLLIAALEDRMQILSTTLPIHADSGPLVLLAHTLVHSAIIKLANTADPAASCWRTLEQSGTLTAYDRRAAASAREMVLLAKQMPSFSCFKGHPFLPDPLACAANYLTSRIGNFPSSNEIGVQDIVRLLRDLQGINTLARVYFD
ncbi:fungal-specific transcription factor domain-containing protein [Penicillium malachiteum]|uniref:Fungal-specific transcription factor domain-containing protein n=1 Tax=Penicillium malachiteum TaxID=1324776 RepID=A0AAD6MUQ7_9EURO|nr:fungal-specific transcription factor domain-containing protein [Penicillium malachiteum]